MVGVESQDLAIANRASQGQNPSIMMKSANFLNWHGFCIAWCIPASPEPERQGNRIMFGLDSIDLQRITVSAMGAALLSLICVLGAVAPAHVGPAAFQQESMIR
jgi:hypothetical protein